MVRGLYVLFLGMIWVFLAVFVAYPDWIVSIFDETEPYNLVFILSQDAKLIERSYFILVLFVSIDFYIACLLNDKNTKQIILAFGILIVSIFIVLFMDAKFKLWEFYFLLILLLVSKVNSLTSIKTTRSIYRNI